jgi:hypothetical protein
MASMVLTVNFDATPRYTAHISMATRFGSLIASCTLAALVLSGCGGGSGGASVPPPPNFSLAVTPTSQSLFGGKSASVSLSATGANGFTSQISVQVSGVPAGVSVSPTTITLVPGTPQQVTLTAAANAAYDTAAITFTGTSGSLTNTASLSLSLVSTFGTRGRSGYIRTDATTEYFEWINQRWAIYNPNTSRFFLTDPFSNHVFVFDATSETEIGTISVPGAYAIDDTPDHATLYVGTLIGDVYTIDPVALTVTQRYMASKRGPHGFASLLALVLANGDVALLGSQGGIPSVDGSTSFAIWTPASNAIQVYDRQGCGVVMGNIGGFTRTVDRNQIILTSVDSDGTLCEFNPSTGTAIHTTAQAFTMHNILTSPDGKYVILPGSAAAVVYDAHTLATVTQFPVLGDATSAAGFAISADSTTLFTPTDNAIYAYNLATGQEVGWVPNIFLPPISGGFAVGPIDSPFLQAVDNTGLFFGPMEEGVGFIDLSTLQSLPVGRLFTNAFLNPAAGPVSGGTQTQGLPGLGNKQGAIYFGGQEATSLTVTGGLATATTPPGPPGPVAVYAFSTDGGEQFIPDGFTYGPTILEATPNMSTAEGGGSGYVYGYGLGPVDSGTIPSDLQVTVGGTTAQVTSFSADAYGVSPFPFPLEFAGYTIPAGVTGSADVKVTNNYGTTTAGFTYLPATKQFPLSGSSLAQGIYDSHTGLYYFTDTNKIQVFSRAQGQWLSSIAIPAPQGTTQRLLGIALSPDGTKLAVSDAKAGVIYLLNPSNPNSVKTFTIPQTESGFMVNPCGVAVSDAGNIYYWVFGGADAADQFFKLNTNTGAVTDYKINGPSGRDDIYLRVAISSDNASVYFNEEGNVFRVDTAGDKLFPASVETGCCGGDYELTLAPNQMQITATSHLYDSDLNGESFYAVNDREVVNLLYLYGAKFSPDGRLLFQPSTIGIDVLDGNVGNLLNRISLPFALSSNYDALVSDGTDNVLIAITGTSGDGIAIVDLTSLSEPSGLLSRHKAVSSKERPGENESRHGLSTYVNTQTIRKAVPPHTPQHVTRAAP